MFEIFLNLACLAAKPTIISESVKATIAGVVLSPVGLATTSVLPSLDTARQALVLPICIPKLVISLKISWDEQGFYTFKSEQNQNTVKYSNSFTTPATTKQATTPHTHRNADADYNYKEATSSDTIMIMI